MKYFVRYTKNFRKDFLKVKTQGKNIEKLQDVVITLREGEKLNKTLHNHRLRGEYQDCMECHIEPDWLLIYHVEREVLVLVRTGSHTELFK